MSKTKKIEFRKTTEEKNKYDRMVSFYDGYFDGELVLKDVDDEQVYLSKHSDEPVFEKLWLLTPDNFDDDIQIWDFSGEKTNFGEFGSYEMEYEDNVATFELKHKLNQELLTDAVFNPILFLKYMLEYLKKFPKFYSSVKISDYDKGDYIDEEEKIKRIEMKWKSPANITILENFQTRKLLFIKAERYAHSRIKKEMKKYLTTKT